MSAINRCGFETGALLTDFLFAGTGTATYDTAVKRTGAMSLKCDSGAGNTATHVFSGPGGTWTAGDNVYASVYLYVPTGSLPSSTVAVLRWNQAATALWTVRMSVNGELGLFSTAGTHVDSAWSDPITLDAWTKVAFRIMIDTGSIDEAELRVNDVTVAASAAGAAISDAIPSRFYLGWIGAPGANKVIQFDDLAFNDDTGSTHTSWPGNEKIGLAVATADAEVDGWTGGAGAITNLFEAVNNIPPAGVDNASATDTSQIECANADITDNYDATMTTYNALGITPLDTITAIVPIIAGANNSTTGTDTVGVSVVSNPAIAELQVSVDADDGTFPTGWLRGVGTIAQNPTVTINTAPVMRVTKGVATTRVATVCFMGMYVAYTVGDAGAPDDLTDLVAWSRSDEITGLSDADPVATWADLSGNGWDWVNAGGLFEQPTYQTNELDGKPVIRFDAAESDGDQLGIVDLELEQPISLMVVASVSDGGTIITTDIHRLQRVGSDLKHVGTDTTVGTIADSAAHVITLVINGANSLGSVDGTASTPFDIGAGVGLDWMLGMLDFFDPNTGDVAEVVIAQGAWNAATRQAVEGYAAWYWGLDGNLPGGHPYKDTPPEEIPDTPATADPSSRSGLRYPLGTGLRQRTLR